MKNKLAQMRHLMLFSDAKVNNIIYTKQIICNKIIDFNIILQIALFTLMEIM